MIPYFTHVEIEEGRRTLMNVLGTTPESSYTDSFIPTKMFLGKIPLRIGFFAYKEQAVKNKISEFPKISWDLRESNPFKIKESYIAFNTLRSHRDKITEERIQAYMDIDNLDDEMKADGFPLSTTAMKDEARRIVDELVKLRAVPTVYGTQDGDIAIQLDSGKSAVVIELNHVGDDERAVCGAACFSYVGGKNRWARYDDSRDLPNDGFVQDRLCELRRES